MEEYIFIVIQEFRTMIPVYDVGVTFNELGVYNCSNLRGTLQAINLNDIKNKSYRIPKWSDVEGEEEVAVAHEWICVTFLTSFGLPTNV